MIERKTFKYFAIMLILLTLAACSRNAELNYNARQHLKSGNFEAAVEYAVRSLEIKLSYDKAQQTLQEAYPIATGRRLQNIERLIDSDSEERWGRLVTEYEALNRLYEMVKSLPPMHDPKSGQKIHLETRDIRRDYSTAKTNAAEYHYQRGMNFSISGSDPNTQKAAALEFKEAQ